MEFLVILVILSLAASAICGEIVGRQKNSGAYGFLFGLLLGPLGVVAAMALDNRETCPECGGRLNGTPRICEHCSSPLSWGPDMSWGAVKRVDRPVPRVGTALLLFTVTVLLFAVVSWTLR